MLYHATYGTKLKSIKRFGLKRNCKQSWVGCKSGRVYLSSDADVAYSYAETTEDISDDDYNSGIFILCINESSLDMSKLARDSNIIDNGYDSCCFEYAGDIKPSKLGIIISNGIVGLKNCDISRIVSE